MPSFLEVYNDNVSRFLTTLSTPDPRFCTQGRASFLTGYLRIRGPWNLFEFSPETSEREAIELLGLGIEAHRKGLLGPFGVRLTPRNDHRIATRIETVRDHTGTPFRPLRGEVVLCSYEDTEGIPWTDDVRVVPIPSATALRDFAELQLRGYGFAEPHAADIDGLAMMYEGGRIKDPEMAFFMAYVQRDSTLNADKSSWEPAGTLVALPDEARQMIGVYGLAVVPGARDRGVAAMLVRQAVNRTRALYGGLLQRHTPTLVSLCDSGRDNEGRLMRLGFRRVEIRTVYGGIEDWKIDEFRKLRRLRWWNRMDA